MAKQSARWVRWSVIVGVLLIITIVIIQGVSVYITLNQMNDLANGGYNYGSGDSNYDPNNYYPTTSPGSY